MQKEYNKNKTIAGVDGGNSAIKKQANYKVRAILGVDGGNSAIKLVLNNKCHSYKNIYCKRQKIEENLVSKYNIDRQMDFANNNNVNIKEMLDVRFTDNNNKQNEFVFGEMCELYIKDSIERTNYKKSDDAQLVQNSLLSVVTTIIDESDMKDLTDEMDIDLFLCTGLPFEEYNSDGTLSKYANKFKGNHTIEFLAPKFPVKKVNLNVVETIVDMEGLAALRQALYEKDVVHSDNIMALDGKVVSLIDIGCYTTDIVAGMFKVTFDEEGNPKLRFISLPKLCFGIEEGIGTAMDATIDNLIHAHSDLLNKGDLTKQDILGAIKNKYKPNELIGKGISIEPYFTKQCSILADELTQKYEVEYSKSSYQTNLIKIYLVGGGANSDTMVLTLENSIKNSSLKNAKLEILEENLFKNAKGYNTMAQVRLNDIKTRE